MKTRLASILGILALTFSAVALAQPQPPQRGVEPSVTGTVVSSSDTSLVIRNDSGAEQSFDVDTSSTIPAGLTPGSRVTVRHHALQGGRQHAASVMRSDSTMETAPVQPTPDTTPPAAIMTPTMPELAPAPEPTMMAYSNAGDRLPETASEMPMLALAGLMTIAAGLVLRALRRRAA